MLILDYFDCFRKLCQIDEHNLTFFETSYQVVRPSLMHIDATNLIINKVLSIFFMNPYLLLLFDGVQVYLTVQSTDDKVVT